MVGQDERALRSRGVEENRSNFTLAVTSEMTVTMFECVCIVNEESI